MRPPSQAGRWSSAQGCAGVSATVQANAARQMACLWGQGPDHGEVRFAVTDTCEGRFAAGCLFSEQERKGGDHTELVWS